MENQDLYNKIIKNRLLIVICGATASGKTNLSIALNEYLPIEIISSDSRQVFLYMDIGTAKPTIEERNAVPHHLIDFIYPDKYYSAGIFATQATEKINQIFENGKIPIVVGGSGLYIKALCEGFFDDGNDDVNSNILKYREEIENRLKVQSIDEIYDELLKVDKASAEKYSDKNPRRVIRALEYYLANGVKFSEAKLNLKYPIINFTPIYFAIDWDRAVLYDRINKRTQQMWDAGLLIELKHLLELGYSRQFNSLNTVGYKEIFDFIDGIATQEETINLIAQHTRNYAKRQFTWFRHIEGIHWIKNNPMEIINIISKTY